MTYFNRTSPSFDLSRASLSLASLASIAVLALAGCGSSDGTPSSGIGPDAIPDDRAIASLRNDCFQIAGKGLPSNVGDSTGDGPISRFRAHADSGIAAWSPIVGSSHESTTSMSRVDRSWLSSSSRQPNAACSSLMPIFSLASKGTGKDEVRYAMTLEHAVSGFQFPKELASAPEIDKAIRVNVTSSLRIEYQHPFVQSDGTIDSDMWMTAEGDAQTWALETTCEKPFTVTPRWEERSGMPSSGAEFCRTTESGSAQCLTFKLDYVGDACSFVARDKEIKLPTGEKVGATFAGFFERATGENATGYALRVTNIEIR